MADLSKKFAAVRAHLEKGALKQSDAPDKIARWFFETLQYPYQLEAHVDGSYESEPEFLGELRGFYPHHADGLSKAFFQPYNSMYHTSKRYVPKQDNHRKHLGVDIFAPFFPYPHEVPVYALAAGTLEYVKTYDRDIKVDGNYEALGNRLRLAFDVPFEKTVIRCYFDYGHLQRFARGLQPGVARQGGRHGSVIVAAGDLIGFAGKTGNADGHFESSTLKSSFKANSGHVHLSFYMDWSMQDPLEVLPRELAFRPVQQKLGYGSEKKEKASRPEIKAWAGPKIREHQPGISRLKGHISTSWNSPLPRRLVTEQKKFGKPGVVQSRAILLEPFHALDFDDLASIQDTIEANRALKSATAIEAGLTIHKAWTASNEAPDTEKWDECVAAFVHRVRSEAAGMKISHNQGNLKGQAENSARALLALTHLHEAFWVLLGGPAFRRLTKGNVQPACGLGVHGEVRAVAYPKGVAALHQSQTSKGWVLSVTFGSGSLRHAMLTETAVTEAPDALKPYMVLLQPLLISSRFAFDFAYRHFRGVYLGEKTPVEQFRSLVDGTAGLAASAAGVANGWDKSQFRKFVELMAEHNKAAMEEARTISTASEDPDGRPISPEFKGLSLYRDGSEVGA